MRTSPDQAGATGASRLNMSKYVLCVERLIIMFTAPDRSGHALAFAPNSTYPSVVSLAGTNVDLLINNRAQSKYHAKIPA